MAENKIATHFEEEGTLDKPKIVGRLVRFAIGGWLIFLVTPIFLNIGALLENGLPLNVGNYIGAAIFLLVLPYVVNIGWRLNSRRLPQIIVIGLSLLLGAFDYLSTGVIYGPTLKVFTLLWILYTATHLGVSFVLAALLATPGCEMRAIPQLWSILTGKGSDEHYCPGFLNGLDRWERGRDSASTMQQ